MKTFEETLDHFGVIPIGVQIPINPKTGKDYAPGTWYFWRWFWGQHSKIENHYEYYTRDENGYPCFKRPMKK